MGLSRTSVHLLKLPAERLELVGGDPGRSCAHAVAQKMLKALLAAPIPQITIVSMLCCSSSAAQDGRPRRKRPASGLVAHSLPVLSGHHSNESAGHATGGGAAHAAGGGSAGAAAATGPELEHVHAKAGQVVIGGRWVDATEITAPAASTGTHHLDPGWGSPTAWEINPLSVKEAADLAKLMDGLGPAAAAHIPEDLQLAFLRDMYANPVGCGWAASNEDADPAMCYNKTLTVIRSAADWRRSVDAARLPSTPLPREEEFRRRAVSEISGTDSWGHPILWAAAAGWPCVSPAVRANFTADEVHSLHSKRFLGLQQRKREISAELGRPISLHCAGVHPCRCAACLAPALPPPPGFFCPAAALCPALSCPSL